ncbi:MAG: carbohydrate ABC transporter permease [Anaerolineae bacterium]|nr:carbohydrate ABC transporter permease [Anaerolineae bacterium]
MNAALNRKLVSSGLNVLTIAIALLIFFPILWMVMTSFKTEADAFASPPQIIFQPTLENWANAIENSPYFAHLFNTLVITVVSTLAAIAIGMPAAYTMAFYPGPRSNFTLMWLMGTRMLPPVGVIVPLYVIFKQLGMFDTHLGLILIYTAMNLPLVVWMMRSFLVDLPYETIEASRIDGTTLLQEFRFIILPLAMPGLMATMLLCFIFSWNEFFLAFNLTISKAAPLSVYIASFKTSEGLFWAKMSAAATLTVAPVIIAGWIAQRQLVRGLTAGAVK